jgi:hypothetical protein
MAISCFRPSFVTNFLRVKFYCSKRCSDVFLKNERGKNRKGAFPKKMLLWEAVRKIEGF